MYQHTFLVCTATAKRPLTDIVHQQAAWRSPIGEEHFKHGQKAAGECTLQNTKHSWKK